MSHGYTGFTVICLNPDPREMQIPGPCICHDPTVTERGGDPRLVYDTMSEAERVRNGLAHMFPQCTYKLAIVVEIDL